MRALRGCPLHKRHLWFHLKLARVEQNFSVSVPVDCVARLLDIERTGPTVEGLAQYYTHLTAEALKEERGYERIWSAYDELTKLQKKNGATVYVNHQLWMDKISPEATRQCLLDLRRGYIQKTFESFCKALELFADRYPMKSRRAHL